MFNRSAYNRTSFNRSSSIVFEWLATANAETDASAAVKIIRHLNGAVEAVAEARGVIIRVVLPSAIAEAESSSVGDYIPGLTMTAGDELIIDTEHMTITLNGANVIDLLSDDSEFFKLKPGENDIIVEGGTTADIKVLWKDRWL